MPREIPVTLLSYVLESIKKPKSDKFEFELSLIPHSTTYSVGSFSVRMSETDISLYYLSLDSLLILIIINQKS